MLDEARYPRMRAGDEPPRRFTQQNAIVTDQHYRPGSRRPRDQRDG